MVKNLVQKVSNILIAGGIISLLAFSGLAMNNTKKLLSMNIDNTTDYKKKVEKRHYFNLSYLSGTFAGVGFVLSGLALKWSYTPKAKPN